MRAKQEAHMKDDTRLALLEQSIGHINETMIRIEKRFDAIDKRFDRLENRIEDVRKNSWSQFCWVMGFMLALSTAFAGILIKGHFG
jgi:hypothetical protein